LRDYIPFSARSQTLFPRGQAQSTPSSSDEVYISTLLKRCKVVLYGHGLHILCGGHCGLGFPSASTWIELESAPASRRVPTRKSKNLFTMELLFEWIGKFNRGNVGLN
jgi:hypothetical protein